MEEETKTVHDYFDILKRRKKSLILPILIVFFIAFIVVLVYPPQYRSMATILIEEQELPLDFVRTTVTGFAEQRLQALNQRIMSSTRLIEIIKRFNLYEDLRKKLTVEEVIEIMRKDIKFNTISADIVDPQRGGAPSPITIAFTLSYDGRNPQAVQQVAGVLSSLFLEENLKVREERAIGASKFLGEETMTLQKQLAGLDAKIARYKEKHTNELPELLQVNLSSIDRVERDIDMLKQQLTTLKEKESYFRAQLVAVPTDAANQDRMLLKELKAKLTQLKSRFSDKHPDVRKTNTEIAELDKRLNVSLPTPNTAVGALKTTFSPLDQPDNPAYVNLASQLVGAQAEIEMVRRQIDEMGKKRDGYYRRIEASPRVEESYKAMAVERNNTQLKFDDLMKKTMEAKVAQGLEKEKMGERFTIIDPARLPEKPVKPNVPAILLIGLFLGIGAGVGMASLQEFNDQSIRDPKTLTAITHLPVLVAIPEIITEKDILGRKHTWKALLIIAVLVFVAGLILFHFFIMDLDILWARVTRKFL
ncbi:MAG: chain-length determining protein [Syntrophus sp. (in: bacteria)]|nr:chain-length determining protein [Syntrophus sp. (in: bacteria)]